MRAVAAGAKALLLACALVASTEGAGAAAIEVADGVVEVAQDGQCSLIEALENANGDDVHSDCTAGEDGLDTIVLASDSIYTLSAVHNVADWPAGPNGLPSITTPIVIVGNGATIERSTGTETLEFRLFHVDYTGDLTIEGLTLRHGRQPETWQPGGAIANLGEVTVTRSTIENNSAVGGGGIYNEDGNATIIETVLRSNFGGGIGITHGHVTISRSALLENSYGIGCIDAHLTVINSTVSGSPDRGIVSEGCVFSLLNCTLSGNSGGGLWVQKQPTTLSNTIIAGSTELDCDLDKVTIDFHGVNLIEDGSCGCTGPSCHSGDPLLGELTDNGGPTPTHALLAGSIAIDKADDTQCPEKDQRGVVRGIDTEGDGSDEDLDGGCDIGAFEAGGFGPAELLVDREALSSDGNGILEPGERVTVAPSWQNSAISPQSLSGTASDFTGPLGATYELVAEDAEYGDVGPAEIASCRNTGICYQMEVIPDGVDRPETHWEATFEESSSAFASKTWTLHIGESFADIPSSSPFYPSIETLLHTGVTAGCSVTEYCPEDVSSRAQMPVFLLKALWGPGYVPQECEEGDEMFADVPFDSPFCPWIRELARRNVTSGCADDAYCPSDPVTRGQLAVFLLGVLEGDEYSPPGCTGVFADVPCSSVFADWVEDLYERGVTSGCGTNPLEYCPDSSVTRGQMSIFLTRTFNLTLYGP